MAPHSAELNGRPKPRVLDTVQTMSTIENPFQSGEPSEASTNSREWSKGSSPTSQTHPEDESVSQPRRRSTLGDRTPTQGDENERRVRTKSPGNSSRKRARERALSIESTAEHRGFETAPHQDSNQGGRDIEERSEDSKYESVWEHQAALSFDGGGIRGYASLLMLQRLMHEVVVLEQTHPNGPHSSSFDFDRPRVKQATEFRQENTTHEENAPIATVGSGASGIGKSQGEQKPRTGDSTTRLGREENNQVLQEPGNDEGENRNDGPSDNAFLPCHYFDFCAGTSTGGLIAIMLGRFRMPVDECLRQYEIFGKQIFGSPRKLSYKGIPFHRHSSKPMVNALQTLTMYKTPKDNEQRSSKELARSTWALRRPATFTPKKPVEEQKKSKKPKRKGKKVIEQPQSKFTTFRSPEDLCKIIAVATRIPERHKSYAYVFRSYKPRFPKGTNFRKDCPGLNNPDKDNVHEQIWQVGRATSAAPTYFKAMKIGEAEYIDGAVEYNNPSYELWKEIMARSRGKTTDKLQVFVSFGTGKAAKDPSLAVSRSPRLVQPLKLLWNIGKHSIARLTDAEGTHTQMEQRFRDHEMPDKYYRFNPDDPRLGTVELDEWIEGKKGREDTLEFIRNAVDKELEDEDTQVDLRKCAKLLVDHRRNRAYASNRKAASRWERFSKCVTFNCPRCEGGEFRGRVDFCSHLTEQHPSEWQKPSEEDEEGTRNFNARLDEHVSGPEFKDGICVGPW